MSSDTRPRRSGTLSKRRDFLRDPMCDARRAGQSRRFPLSFHRGGGIDRASVRDELLALMDRKHHWAYPALTRPGLSRRSSSRTSGTSTWCTCAISRSRRAAPSASGRRSPTCAPRSRRTSTKSRRRSVRRRRRTRAFPPDDGGPRLLRRFEDGAAELHPAAVATAVAPRSASRSCPGRRRSPRHGVRRGERERARRARGDVRARRARPRSRHPLVAHYGCPPSAMDLTRAHAAVEGGAPADAWRIVLAPRRRPIAEARAVEDVCSRGARRGRVPRRGGGAHGAPLSRVT